MKLRVERFKSNKKSTIGLLFVNDVFQCYTLEDEIRPNGFKIWGNTAVPTGTYNLIMSFSNKFQKYLPEILNIKDFKGVRIHTGNTIEDTHGCLLVGEKTDGVTISQSVIAFDKLMYKILPIEKSEKITIEYVNTNKTLNNIV